MRSGGIWGIPGGRGVKWFYRPPLRARRPPIRLTSAMAGTGAGTSWASDNILSLSLSLGSLSCCSLGVSGRHDLPSLDDDAEDFSHPFKQSRGRSLVLMDAEKMEEESH